MRQQPFLIFAILVIFAPSCMAQGSNNVVSSEEYSVYSAILNRIGVSPSDGKKATLVVIRNTTDEAIDIEMVESVGKCEKGILTRKIKPLVDAMLARNQNSSPLTRKFTLSRRYVLISQKQFHDFFKTRGASGWEDYYRKYPHGTGFNMFSRVGFNSSKTEAMVYAGVSCNVICGYFSFIYLRKVKGHWKVIAEYDCDPTR